MIIKELDYIDRELEIYQRKITTTTTLLELSQMISEEFELNDTILGKQIKDNILKDFNYRPDIKFATELFTSYRDIVRCMKEYLQKPDYQGDGNSELPDALQVKVQDKCSFDDFTSVLSDIDYLVNKCSVVYQLNDKEEAVIDTIKQGSIVLVIAISQAALMILGSIAKISIGVVEEKRKQKEFMMYAEKMNVKSEFDKVARSHLTELMHGYSKALLKESVIPYSNEDINNLAIGIDKMSSLLDTGVGFYPTLGSKTSVVESFPSVSDMDSLVEKALERIEAGKNKTQLDAHQDV